MSTTQPSCHFLLSESALLTVTPSLLADFRRQQILPHWCFPFSFFVLFSWVTLKSNNTLLFVDTCGCSTNKKEAERHFFPRDAQQHASRKRSIMSGKSRSISEHLLSVGLFLALQIQQDLDEWAVPRCLGVCIDVCVQNVEGWSVET